MNFEGEIFVYKLYYDAGTAPCISDGTLSLAICKPGVRNNAKKGDLVVGIAAKEIGIGRFIYAMEVEEVISGDRYYTERRFAKRIDRVYRDSGGGRAKHKGRGYPNYQPGAYWRAI